MDNPFQYSSDGYEPLKTQRTAQNGQPQPADEAMETVSEESVPETVLLKQQLDQEKERVLRAYAELENFKRRKAQERESYIKLANEDVIAAILPVVDSFKLALHQPGAFAESKEGHQFLQGFELIYKQLWGILQKLGVSEVQSQRVAFNPDFHQAISQQPAEGVAPGMVVKEVQSGYKLHDKVIRPAMVVVAA